MSIPDPVRHGDRLLSRFSCCVTGTCPHVSRALIEIKLGGNDLVEKGAATLNELEAKINPEKMRMPAFKMVLTAIGEYSYRRPNDKVWVVPIGCLRP